jgi:hypothetical protein
MSVVPMIACKVKNFTLTVQIIVQCTGKFTGQRSFHIIRYFHIYFI